PILIAVFGASDLIAKGTSLLAMIPTAVTGTVANTRAGLVRLKDGLVIGLAAMASSFGGASIAFLLPPALSSILFGCFIVLIVIQLTIRGIGIHRSARRAADEDGGD